MKRVIAIIATLFVFTQINAEEMKINVIVGSKTFPATISDTSTGRAFYDMLPLTLDMNELNGNEKYCYLDTSLPTASYRPGTIHTGDLLLYGSSCVVLFYETFSSGYSYSRIGALDNVEGLADALGSGNVTVTFDRVTSVETAIHAASDKANKVAIFDLQGHLVQNSELSQLPKGVYIVKYGNGETRKIIK